MGRKVSINNKLIQYYNMVFKFIIKQVSKDGEK